MWIKTYVENWGGSVKKQQIKTKNDKGKKTGGGDGVEKLIGAGVDIRVKKKRRNLQYKINQTNTSMSVLIKPRLNIWFWSLKKTNAIEFSFSFIT